MKTTSDHSIRIRIPASLDVATYIGVAAMSLLGISGFVTLKMQLIALSLCLLFGVLYHLFFRTGRYQRHPNIYFGIQAIVLALVFLLGSKTSDAFNFLFLLLTIQTAVVLPGKLAAIWIAIYYASVSGIVLFTRGIDGLFAILFYLIAYVVSGFFGYTLQQAERARERNQQLLEELQTAQLKLQELAVMEERNRLARELHDSLGHRLTVAIVQLEGAQRLILTDPDRAANMIGTMRDQMKEAMAELRHTVTALRNPLEDAEDMPLGVALTHLAQTFQDNTGLVVHLDLPDSLPALPATYRLALYRAAQESLTNAQRHAAAKQVWLTVSATQGRDTLTVADDGKGWGEQGDTRASGYGLRGLRERATQLGGELSLELRPGGGAQLRFSLPAAGDEANP